MPVTKVWLGGAPKVAQVDRRTVGTVAAGNTLTVTCNGNTFTYTCGSATEATEATAFAAAWNLIDNVGEFMETEASASGDDVLFTARDAHAGKPFTYTYGAAGGAATFNASGTAGVTNSGPNDLAVASNYSSSGLPGNGDTLVFENSDVSALYNLSALAGVTGLIVRQEQSFTGKIRLPRYNTDGAVSYPEYRSRWLNAADIVSITVGIGDGDGSPAASYDCGTNGVPTTVVVHTTGAAEDPLLGALEIIGTDSGSTLELRGGSVTVAVQQGRLAVLATVRQNGGTLTLGPNATLETSATVRGGTLASEVTVPTLDASNCTVTLVGTAAVTTTASLENATLIWNSSGTITAGSAYAGGLIDAEQAEAAFTITDFAFYPNSGLLDGFKRGTYTNAFTLPGGGDVADRQFRFGPGRTLKPT